MIGAIIGDIAGSVYEFNNTRNYNFNLLGPYASFTDDTICTIAVADAMLNGKDFAGALRSWCGKYPRPMGGYGLSFSRWLATPNAGPYDSFGNGAAMRVSPCGYAMTLAEARRLAIDSAKVSHDNVEGLLGAMCVAETIWRCKQLPHPETRKVAIRELRRDYYWGAKKPAPGEWCETCQGCVPLALDIVGKSKSFEDAIRRAVSYGGDSDTLGAIVGGIAEVVFGVPCELREKALGYLPKDMIKILTKFEKKYE